MTDYTVAQLKNALIAADKAGDDVAARRIVQEIKAIQSGGSDIVERGQVLPLGRTASGELTFATPQFARDIFQRIQSAGTPGASPEQITEAALDVGALRPVAGIGGVGMKTVTQPLTREQIEQAPTAQQLKQQGGKLFKSATGDTSVISPEGYQRTLLNIEDDLFQQGFDPQLHPTVNAAFGAMSKRLGADLDMQELQTVRRHAQKAASSLDPDEARLGMRMIDKVDDYVENMTPFDLISGDTAKAASDLKSARKTWSQMRKTEMIEEAFEKARSQASGFENGLRIQFRQLLNNQKKMRGFTDEEKSAMRDVVEGDFTRNTLKRLGKLGFGSGQQTNVLGGAAGAGGGALAFGPIGAAAVPVVGYGAQRMGEQMTKRSAEKARALTAGTTPQQVQSPTSMRLLSQGILAPTIGQTLNRPLEKRYNHPTAGLLKLPLI